jgi:hypothetical protein
MSSSMTCLLAERLSERGHHGRVSQRPLRGLGAHRKLVDRRAHDRPAPLAVGAETKNPHERAAGLARIRGRAWIIWVNCGRKDRND